MTSKSQPFLSQIDDVFTKEQCKTLIDYFESQKSNFISSGVAQYQRVILDDKRLADTLYNNLKSFIPPMCDGKPVVGLNRVFRFSKYSAGEGFSMHKDGYNRDHINGTTSAMTLNIFLNDDFEGGETNFYHTMHEKDLRFSVVPKAGRGALFASQQYHMGKTVTKGFKYLIRTDVMVYDF